MIPANKRSVIPAVAAVAAGLIAAAWIALIQVNTEKPEERVPNKYVLPEDFTGRIKIIYTVEGAPALETKDGYRIIPIPRSGQFYTSSNMLYGHAIDEFVRESSTGEPQHLHVQYLGLRKNGLVGDDKEYFESPEELEYRDEQFEERGAVDSEGRDIMGKPYELIVIRDDFE